jgi:hypothetical protein
MSKKIWLIIMGFFMLNGLFHIFVIHKILFGCMDFFIVYVCIHFIDDIVKTEKMKGKLHD